MLKTMSLKLSEEARQRLAWMDAYRECGNGAQVVRHFSIPLRTFFRWKKRYDPWDLKSLENHSRRPRRFPRRTSWNNEKAVLELKRAHPRWGKEKLSLALRNQGIIISGKTCWKICKRHSLIVRYKTRKRRAPKPRVNLASIKLPGDLFQLDTKHVNLHGRKVYQYTIIDVVSKKRHADIYWHADMATTVKFLEATLKELLFSPKMIQTDNGAEFGRMVSQWCRSQGIRHVFSHK
ncbi:DDE-type integrase/transposase/recombinase, partial [Deltaproteobacteria bacterium TL4]